jgi:predicted MFS family arabinose efflux permease
LLLGAVAATGIGVLSADTMPLLVGALMDDLSLSEARAGPLGSVELAAGALVSISVAHWVGRISRRTLALAGAVLVIAGCLISAAVQGYAALTAARLGVGLGSGAILAAGNAAVAACRDPDRLYARMSVIGGLAIALVIGLLPLALRPWGYAGGFLVVGLLALACTPLVLWLPPNPPADVEEDPERLPRKLLASCVMLAVLLESISGNALWVFSERIGLRAGLELEQVAIVLGVTTVIGLLGAVLATLLGTRVGRTLPLSLGLGIGALAKWAMVAWQLPLSFITTNVILAIAWFFALPYMLGMTAALDRLGRWSAVAIGAMSCGAALGPGLAGLLIGPTSYAQLTWFCPGLTVCALVLLIPVARRLD